MKNFHCAGFSDSMTKPCAVNAGSFWHPFDWVIMQDGQQLRLTEKVSIQTSSYSSVDEKDAFRQA
jgi:hypothetical protein